VVSRLAYLAVYIPASMIGWVVSKLILFLLFAFLFVPIGLVNKRRSRNALNLRWQDDLTLWREYNQTAKDPSGYYRQF
jgi:hypothetical protein